MHLLLLLCTIAAVSFLVDAKWVIGDRKSLAAGCKGLNMRFLAVNRTGSNKFSGICSSGGEKTIWKLNLTGAQVQEEVTKRKGTLNDLIPYYVKDEIRFGIIILPEAAYLSYWYWGLSFIEVNTKFLLRGGSITSLVPYTTSTGARKYSIVGTKNEKVKNYVLANTAPERLTAKVNSMFASKSYRVAALYPGKDGMFDALLQPTSKKWYFLWGVSEKDARSKASKANTCVTSAVPHDKKWAVTFIDCSPPKSGATIASIASNQETTTKGNATKKPDIKSESKSITVVGNRNGSSFSFSSSSSFSTSG